MTPDRDDFLTRDDAVRERTDDSRERVIEGPRRLSARSTPVPALDSLEDRRVAVVFRQQEYHLRHDDVALLRDVGTFRTIYAEDLRTSFAHLDRDLRTLREQGLLTTTTIHRADTREPATVVNLTRTGRDLIQMAEVGEQRYYSDAVRLREVHHDAALWRIYQHVRQDADVRGASVEQIRLDHELKHALWTAQGRVGDAEGDPADALGLPRDPSGHVRIPDFQVIAREADGTLTRCNVELVTRHYASATVRAKAAAGFVIYDESAAGGRGDDRDLASKIFEL
jgi:hypothetical protein